MDRFTISLDKRLADAFDRLLRERGYASRSEAVRDILRRELQSAEERRDGSGSCVANLSYVYNHEERELAERLTHLQHANHDLLISTMHAHLDHEHCIETVLLRGSVQCVRQLAEALIAERGVRHGSLNLVSAAIGSPHGHGSGAHRHLMPKF